MPSTATRPTVALLLGDPTGIGPEIVAKVLGAGALAETAQLVVVGDARLLERGMRETGTQLRLKEVASPRGANGDAGVVPIIDLADMDPAALPRGEVSAEAGRLTGATLANAIELALAGEVDAITFAPLNKAALNAGGWRFADEHQMFAHLLDHQGHFAEMNVLDGQWMSRVTGHVSMRRALDLITPQSIGDAVRLADRTMRRAGIARPRLAVAALNPHAGENGLFGREEIDMIAPTVKALAAEGIDCTGPYPADTIYLKAFAGAFDGVVAMYHDQGQIATKLKGFNRGVTVTAGLETVFTTPAHGTAFDIVGTGKASTGALENAIRLAAKLAS